MGIPSPCLHAGHAAPLCLDSPSALLHGFQPLPGEYELSAARMNQAPQTNYINCSLHTHGACLKITDWPGGSPGDEAKRSWYWARIWPGYTEVAQVS